MRGEIVKENGVLRIARVQVTYKLRVREDARDTAERVHAVHKEHCPVARTIMPCVEVETEIRYVE